MPERFTRDSRDSPLRQALEGARFATPAQHPLMRMWEDNVGPSLVLDVAPIAPGPVERVDVLCWNLGVGTARVAELLARLRQGEFGGAGADPKIPLVILAQEAFRSDSSVPAQPASRFYGGGVDDTGRHSVASVAGDCGLSLVYVPSMRNGTARSDRGNAVLSTASLSSPRAFFLPYLRQRRVAVSVELTGVPGITFVTAHLESRPQIRGGPGWWMLGRRAEQAVDLAQQTIQEQPSGSVVLGADLNTPFGVRDPAHRALVAQGFLPARRVSTWRHTFHGPMFLPLDHLLFRSPAGRIRGVEVRRLDEHRRDWGVRVFGSDHHPLLARVDLTPG